MFQIILTKRSCSIHENERDEVVAVTKTSERAIDYCTQRNLEDRYCYFHWKPIEEI